MFCPNLQTLLKAIYDLMRKGKPFEWTKLHQEAFEEIKSRLIKPIVLHLPENIGRFKSFSDRTVAGSILCQIKNGALKLIK